MPRDLTVQQPAELLAFLFASHPEVKRSKVQQWLKYKTIQVNGRTTTQFNHALQIGDVVSFAAKSATVATQNLPVGMQVWFEDASIIVIEKPAGMLSMASDAQRQKTAYAYLTEYVRRGKAWAGQRVWIVHRLDRETSGLMVFAKTEGAKQTLQSQWQQGRKCYLAVVEGNLSEEQGTFTSHLDENSPFKVYSGPASAHTREAITQYRVVKRKAGRTLVELTLETGRRHQIRVQLADAGCPVVGDKTYEAKTNPARRLALHACALQFMHPVSGEPLSFQLPLPRELAMLV